MKSELRAAGRPRRTEDEERETALGPGALEDPAHDGDFGRLTRLAATAFRAGMSVISGIDHDTCWLKAAHRLELPEGCDLAFLARALAEEEAPVIVPDTGTDERLGRRCAEASVGFLAAAPVVMHKERIGWLCVLDREPHPEVDPEAVEQLVDLAAIAGSLFERKEEARVRARTSAQLIKEEWRHALTLEAGKVGSWVWDIRSKELTVNEILRRMFKIDPSAPVTIDDILGFIHPDDRSEVETALNASFAEGVDYFSEFRVNSGRWLIGRGRVYQRDAAGNPLVMMGVNIDVTDAKEAADHTRFLLRELNHRVKNTLAMIQSLARHSLRQGQEPHGLLDAFSGRLRTISEAHVLLSDRDWSGVGLMELVNAQVGPYIANSPEQVVIEGEDVQLPPDHALGLGLILHELSSNAVRYGALSNDRGKVTIKWSADVQERPTLSLLWRESDGPPVSEPRQLGFGSRLIHRSLDKILESQVVLEFRRTGVEARVAFPLPG